MEDALEFLHTEMGQGINKKSRMQASLNFREGEMNQYMKQFQLVDSDRKGYLTARELRICFEVCPVAVLHVAPLLRFKQIQDVRC